MTDIELIGGLLLLTMLSKSRVEWGAGWFWPVPDLLTREGPERAVISQEFRGAGDRHPHYGVDIMFRARRPPPAFTAPEGTPIMAAHAGNVWSVQRTARGWAVVIDHGKPFATFYQHLETVNPELVNGAQGVQGKGPGREVIGGEVIGTMGSDPLDGGHVRHLHFAVWYQGSGNAASIDPSSEMATWQRSTIPWIT